MSAVRRAIEQLDQQLPVDEKRVDPNPQTRLTGEDGCLDSLGLIDLIFNTEKASTLSLTQRTPSRESRHREALWGIGSGRYFRGTLC
jgi:acyl carrier protein